MKYYHHSENHNPEETIDAAYRICFATSRSSGEWRAQRFREIGRLRFNVGLARKMSQIDQWFKRG